MPVLLRRHNLNLLPILRELLRTQSVSRTAESVGLTQSSVSAALANLREIFHDELLVQVGRKMMLTTRARELRPQAERAFAEAEALLQPIVFDPASLNQRFVIATSDYVTFLLAPALTGLVEASAPNASLHFTDLATDVDADMARGEIDLAIVPRHMVGGWTEVVEAMPLFDDESVVIASRRNRSFGSRLTPAIYEAGRHAVFQVSPRHPMTYPASVLRGRQHLAPRTVVLVQQFLALPAIVEGTDCMALVQRRLAERFREMYEIEIFPAPFEAIPLQLHAYWSRTNARSAAHGWLRDRVLEAVGVAFAPPRPAGRLRRV